MAYGLGYLAMRLSILCFALFAGEARAIHDQHRRLGTPAVSTACTPSTLTETCTPSGEGHFYFCSDRYVWEWQDDKGVDVPVNISDSLCITMESSVTGLKDDVIMVIGGCDAPYQNKTNGACDSVTLRGFIFDVKNNNFTETGAMPHDRFRFAAANDSQYIYIFGGRTVEDELVCAIDYLDVTTGEWGTIDGAEWDNGYCASDLGSWTDDSGTIYLVGGYDANLTTCYGTVNRVTITKDGSGVPTGASFALDDKNMTQARGDFSCVLPPGSGYAYCMGGFSTPDQSTTGDWTQLDVVEKYQVASNGGQGAWSSAASMIQARGDYAAAYIDGRITVIGGEDLSGPIRDVEWYTVDEDCWTDSGDVFDIPTDRFRYCGAPVPSEDRIYLFGGQGGLTDQYSQGGSYLLNDQVLWYQETPLTDGNGSGALQPSVCTVLAAAIAAVFAVRLAGAGPFA